MAGASGFPSAGTNGCLQQPDSQNQGTGGSSQGLEVQVPKDDPNRFQLRSAMADFLEEIKLSRQDKTWQGYKVSFTYFQQSCDKKCVDEYPADRSAAFLRLPPRQEEARAANGLQQIHLCDDVPRGAGPAQAARKK